MTHRPTTLSTRWSMLDRLTGSHAEDSWRWFIERYRGFVVAALQRLLPERGEARRAADEFWGYLFTTEAFARADRARRFRSFLSGTVRNYARERLRAQRRTPRSIEPDQQAEPLAQLPEDEEVRLWAHTVLELCIESLRQSYPVTAKALCWFYGVPLAPGAEPEQLTSSQIAARLGIETAAIHQHLHRGRTRLRRFLHEELTDTVNDRDSLDDELRLLIAAILDSSPGLVDR